MLTIKLDSTPLDFVSNFALKYTFDGMYYVFSFSTTQEIPYINPSVVDVSYDGVILATGIIIGVSVSKRVYTADCVSLSWLLTKTTLSQSAVAWKLKEVVISDVCRRFCDEVGNGNITVIDDLETTVAVKEYAAEDTAAYADIIKDLARLSNVVCKAEVGGNDFVIYRPQYQADAAVVLSENDGLTDVSAQFSAENLYKYYYGVSNGDIKRKQLPQYITREFSDAPHETNTIIRSKKDESLERTVENTMKRNLVNALTIKVSVPQILTPQNNLFFAGYNCVLNAPSINTTGRQFLIKEVSQEIASGGEKTELTLCYSFEYSGE